MYFTVTEVCGLCVCCELQCPFNENFCRNLLVGIKLEVINTDTEITEYPVYWMARVVDVAGELT